MSSTEAARMPKLTQWIAAPILAISLLTVKDAPPVEAQGFSFGSRGLSIQIGQTYPSYYTRSPSRYYPSYHGFRAPSCYDHFHLYRHGTASRRNYGFYDYPRTDFYRYGNGYKTVPRYFDYRFGPHCGRIRSH